MLSIISIGTTRRMAKTKMMVIVVVVVMFYFCDILLLAGRYGAGGDGDCDEAFAMMMVEAFSSSSTSSTATAVSSSRRLVGDGRLQSRLRPSSASSFSSCSSSALYQQKKKSFYGRGAEIWPEAPRDEVIVLADSFPNGEIPFVAVTSIGEADIMDTIHQQEEERRRSSSRSGASSIISSPDKNAADSDLSTESSAAISSSSDQQQLVRRRRRVGRKRDALKRILRRAAAKEELDAESSSSGDVEILEPSMFWPSSIPWVFRLIGQGWTSLRRLERTPALVVSAILLGTGNVRPLDVAAAATITSYIVILTMASQSYRDDSYVPYVPACPPQGHVPTMVTNPLGRNFAGGAGSSETGHFYDKWLRSGAIVGCVIPTLWTMGVILADSIPASMMTSFTSSSSWVPGVIQRTITTLAEAAAASPSSLSSPVRACARHLFLLCCQIMTEASTKRRVTTVPLPIRVLVPCIYNTIRLQYLWWWVQSSFLSLSASSSLLSTASLVLAVLNMVYWSLNLFGFVIPIATMRYMRSHFFCVEAEEVTLRQGLEETIGLVPNYNNGDSLTPY